MQVAARTGHSVCDQLAELADAAFGKACDRESRFR